MISHLKDIPLTRPWAGAPELPADEPTWLASLRKGAAERFAELGLPTRQLEDWRFTNLEPIARTAFEPPPLDASIDPGQLERVAGRFTPIRLVFVNGGYAPQFSSNDQARRGLEVMTVAEAIGHDGKRLAPHLGRYASYAEDAFTALNTAAFTDGLLIHVQPDARPDPVHLVYASVPGDKPAVCHPRNLIICGPRSQLTVIEHYVSMADGVYLNNAVTEIAAGPASEVTHYFVEEESEQAYNISTLACQQQADSKLVSHSILLGGALVRNNIRVVLDGSGSHCLINGLFAGHGRQHLDNFMRVEHAKSRCASRQFYKGILDEKAHGVFSGRIYVAPDAQQTDAKQTNANLLLSDQAQIDSKPQLEIYADDVKCTHGATIGQIDEDAVFYLRSRGIDLQAARAMITYAFAAESLQRMQPEPLRRALAGKLLARLPQGDLLKSLM